MIAPGVLLSAVAVGLIVAYLKIKVIRENWIWKISFPVAAFALGILGLLLLLGGLDELSYRWR